MKGYCTRCELEHDDVLPVSVGGRVSFLCTECRHQARMTAELMVRRLNITEARWLSLTRQQQGIVQRQALDYAMRRCGR